MLRSATALTNHSYEAWLARVKRVQSAYAAGRIKEADLRHYQRYLMSFGQVNANFTLEELRNLNYPKSPMMLMDKHAYSRMTENVFTEILRQLLYKLYPQYKNDYPIFIDSSLFFKEIERFATVIDAASLKDKEPHSLLLKEVCDKAGNGVWVKVKDVQDKDAFESSIQNECLNYIIENEVPAELQACFRPQQQHQHLTSKQLSEIEAFLVEEIKLILHREQQSEKPLDTAVMHEARDNKWYERCFRFLKSNQHAFLTDNNVKKPADLQKLAINQPDEFDQQYEMFKPLWETELLKRKDDGTENKRHGRCLTAINSWRSKRISSALKRVFYFIEPKTRIFNLDCIIVIGKNEEHSHDHKGPKYLINNLGYRINVIRAMDAVIDILPRLFFDEQQTKEFFEFLINTPMVQKLGEKKNNETLVESEIDRLKSAIAICQTESVSPAINQRDRTILFEDAHEGLKGLHCETSLGYYKTFILTYVARFLELYTPDNVMYDIMLDELTDILVSFNDASRSGNLRHAIRAVQTLCEILQTDLGMTPLPQELLMTHTIKSQLFGKFDVQSVKMAPFGMRTYLRVLQACEDLPPTGAKKRVFQTNQNYFEWIMSLRSVKTSRLEVNYVRQLNNIDSNADIIFMEIHTNNVTEKKQFAQHLDIFLLSLRESKWKKPLTLVIDITLNALDDKDLMQSLTIADDIIKSGRLNIVLNVSLTKLYQAGTDKLSGGLNIVINNAKDWGLFNANFNRVTDLEGIDEATLQYFSYFNHCKHQMYKNFSTTIEYVKMINGSVDWFYQAVLERLARAGFENQRCFKLTTTSDSGSIYLALHSSQLLAVLDPAFKLRTSQIEQFNKDIVNQLIIPMSVKSGIPLTGRMSIGFPLCSVNVAVDSIRFTVGIERYTDLLIYADIIAHVSYELNHHKGLVQKCFEADPANADHFPHRQTIFTKIVDSYVRLYVGIPPNRTHPYAARKPRNNRDIFGPFATTKGPAYFSCVGNEFSCRIADAYYKNQHIAFVSGLIITPAIAYSAEQFEFFLKSTAYTIDINAAEIKARTSGADFNGYTQYIPVLPSAFKIDFTQQGIGIEHNFISTEANGLTVYKHPFSPDTVAIEIDYWQEKDPAVARFIRFAIAIFINRAYKADFKAKGDSEIQSSMFIDLLFKMDYKIVDTAFQRAVNDVLACKAELTNLLYRHMSAKPVANNKQKIYAFHGESAPGAPHDTSIYDGASQTTETALVSDVITIINQHRARAAKHKGLALNFFNTSKSTGKNNQPAAKPPSMN